MQSRIAFAAITVFALAGGPQSVSAQTTDATTPAAPPVSREVQISIEIQFPKENTWRRLADVSPVVRALATEQFDDYVKRVRIFAEPSLACELAGRPEFTEWLHRCAVPAG